MPIFFEQSDDTNIDTEFKEGMDKLLSEYPLTNIESINNAYWVYAIFNERIVGAMLVETLSDTQVLAHYLAVRKVTQNRGVGREIINRWAKKANIEILYSDQLKMIIGDFK